MSPKKLSPPKAAPSKKPIKKITRTFTAIGLDQVQSVELADKLNDLLSNYQVFYMNVRGFHWNIKGDKFFELHLKFEELYTNLQIKIDEIAERILTLGHAPLHGFEEYLSAAVIKPAKNINDGKKATQFILDAFKVLITKQRVLLNLSDVADDEGTNAQMSDYIREQEKQVWMYSSWLGV
ncbi:MAG: Dps family protein [Bacteroidia bacterium]